MSAARSSAAPPVPACATPDLQRTLVRKPPRRDLFAAARLHRGDVMVLTRSFVRAKRPCTDGFRWFVRQFNDGGHYQELLDQMVAAGRVGDACWLLEQFGPTDEVREVDAIDAEAIVFSGTLRVRGGVEVDGIVRVGRRLQAGGGLRVGGELIVGEDVRIEGAVRAEGRIEIGGDLRVGWGVDCAGELHCRGEARIGWDLRCAGRLRLDGNAFVGLDLHGKDDIRCGKGLQVGGDIVAEASLRAEQGITAGGSIDAALHLEAGWGTKAGNVVTAGGAIRAGEGLHAGEAIRAGEGYGVFAGLGVHMEAWEASARVSAAHKPAGLMSGWWAGPAAC